MIIYTNVIKVRETYLMFMRKNCTSLPTVLTAAYF